MPVKEKKKASPEGGKEVRILILACAAVSAIISAITAYVVAAACFKKIDEYVDDIFKKLKDVSELIERNK